MQRMSLKVRKENSNDKFFNKCCIPGCPETKVEWHHPLMYSGRQIADIVVPLCINHHRGNNGTITKEGKLWSELWAITRYREILPTKYPKYNWYQRKKWLETQLKITL